MDNSGLPCCKHSERHLRRSERDKHAIVQSVCQILWRVSTGCANADVQSSTKHGLVLLPTCLTAQSRSTISRSNGNLPHRNRMLAEVPGTIQLRNVWHRTVGDSSGLPPALLHFHVLPTEHDRVFNSAFSTLSPITTPMGSSATPRI